DAALVAPDIRKDLVQRASHPGQLGIGNSHRLDGQCAVRAMIVAANEPIRLEPASERCLGDLVVADFRLAEAATAVPQQLVARLQLSRLDEPTGILITGSPYQVVRRYVERVSGLRVQPQ